MSGYDPATGVYELTETNAREWFDDFFDRIARILAKHGLEVLFKGDSYLLVRATPAAIWTALTGKPGTSKDQNAVFGARRYTARYLGHIVKPRYPPRPSTSCSMLLISWTTTTTESGC